jgi:hypothetical protein
LNDLKLKALPGTRHSYQAVDIPGVSATGQPLGRSLARAALNNSTLLGAVIELRVGAVVILLVVSADH